MRFIGKLCLSNSSSFLNGKAVRIVYERYIDSPMLMISDNGVDLFYSGERSCELIHGVDII